MLNPQVVQLLQQYLAKFAATDSFTSSIESIFGTNIGVAAIRQQWLSGDFSLIPEIRVLSSGELGTANGAYAASLDEILVSSNFLAQHQDDMAAVAGLLLEEVGHKLDRVLNGSVDSPGDEGAIFRILASGQTLLPETLAGLRATDDRAVITVDGQSVEIEKQDFDFRNNPGNYTLTGTEGDDRFFLGAGTHAIDGAAGSDLLFINNSADATDIVITYTTTTNGTISGGFSNGTTFQNIEAVYFITGSGNDNINVTAASADNFGVRIFAGAGNDTIVGSSIGNEIHGEDGNDNITGGNNTDYLFGGAGNDTLNGLDGNDLLDSGTGADIIDGGAGGDFLIINNSLDTTDTTITYTTTNGTISGGSNNGTTFRNIERVTFYTGSGNDNINISAVSVINSDTIFGGGGNTIYAGDGNDIVIGGAIGVNEIHGEGGDDNITGGNNIGQSLESLYGENGNDILRGLEGNDRLDGGAGNDILNGVNSNSSNPGLGEQDIFRGGTGIDRFILGDSANVYYDDRNSGTSGNNDYVLITDFNPSEDIIQLQGVSGNYTYQYIAGSSILLYDKPDGEPDELIAEFSNSNGLNLNSNAFAYVSPLINFGTLAFANSQFSINEDGTPIIAVTVNRTGGSDGAVSSTISLSDGTALAAIDYNNVPIIVNFANGETSKTITIPIINDTKFEPNETINLALNTPTGGAILGSQKTAVVTIIDDDLAKSGILTFSNSQFSVKEDGTPIDTITITRTGGSDGNVGATITLRDGTAKAGSDYNNVPININFSDGETSKTVNIPIVNDSNIESNETIQLLLTTGV